MRKILFCWELGEDYGYLGKILALTKQFSEDPIHFFVVSKNLSATSKIEWPSNVKFIQAPICLQANPLSLKASSFAEILFYKGYDSHRHLRILSDAWLTIFEAINPDVILFDYAPTALLAASGLTTPKIIIGNPYLTPPPGSSVINLTPGIGFDEHRANDIHQAVIRNINLVKREYLSPAIQAIGDLFTADATYLSGYSETDYFCDSRVNTTYCGAALSASISNRKPHWKPGLCKKSIAYLKHRDPRSKTILKTLASLEARTLCFYSGGKEDEIMEFSNSSLNVTNIPFDFTAASRDATAIICHGGQGVVNNALSRGIPLILVPTQAEQYYITSKVIDWGIGIIINRNDSPIEIRNSLSSFFSTSKYSDNAKYYAETKFKIDSASVHQEIYNKIRSFIF
ncbi:glycosyltransferase [Cellvibrio sp. NN19]|uniref:glycosyltransferase n=1 Tax=Cellvibrio chitinivorans TaxID=3102792 RepID=UPI002B4162E0|nr:nucleotide disphospho-sugar-binding domain-containing protein [Cellvibrio sp. NN19]